jgi:regulator of sigma E protease
MSDDLGNRFLAEQNDFARAERDKKRADKTYMKRNYILATEFVPFVIDSVMPLHAADLAGMQKGDSVVAVNGIPTPCHVQVTNELQKHPCDSITLDYYRQGELHQAHLFIGDQALIGVIIKNKYQYFPIEHKSYTFLESIPAGIKYGWATLVTYVKQMRLVFTKEGAQSVGGFGAIGSMFPGFWNWFAFWHMTAFLSLILAFMNFLPIPALDGGYVLFLLFEMITGKQPSDKFLEVANNIGFWLLIALLIFANGNDILKLFF